MDDAGTGAPAGRRPTSLISPGLPSEVASSLYSSPRRDAASATVDDHRSIAARRPMKLPIDPRHLAPHETTAADILIACLRRGGQVVGAQNATFTDTVSLASETIRFNSKWFSETQLTAVLNAALVRGSTTTSSAELMACVDLIMVVGTYSYLPLDTLDAIARLISYGYYQGRRAAKLKRLKRASVQASEAIFASHLKENFTGTLLYVLQDDHSGKSREHFAQAHGAMTILTKRLLSEQTNDDAQADLLSAMLRALRGPSTGGVVLKEHTLKILGKMLRYDGILSKIGKLALWDDFVQLVDLCKDAAEEMVEPAVDSLADRALTPNQQLLIANVYLRSGRPLPKAWSETIVTTYIAADKWNLEDEDTNQVANEESDNLFDALCCHDEGAPILRLLVTQHLGTHTNDPQQFAKVCKHYVQIATDAKVSAAVAGGIAGTLADHLSKYLSLNAYRAKEVFGYLCEVAEHGHPVACSVALRTLLRVRVTVTGVVYLKKEGFFGAAWVSQDIMAMLQAGEKGTLPHLHARLKTPGGSSCTYLTSLPFHRYESLLINLLFLGDWEAFSLFLYNFSDQLANLDLFFGDASFVIRLRDTVSRLLKSEQPIEPPVESGITKAFVAERLIHIFTMLVGYHHLFDPHDVYKMVQDFIQAASMRGSELSKPCVHALTVCCYEVPDTVARLMPTIVDSMAKIVTQRDIAMHVLEFMAGLSRLPKLYRNFNKDDYRRVFAVCDNYLAGIRKTSGELWSGRKPPSISSGSASGTDDITRDLATYVHALAHHVITFWYIAMKPQDRRLLKPYIIKLLRHEVNGKSYEDAGYVTLDMMDRIDAEEENKKWASDNQEPFDKIDGLTKTTVRIAGTSLITTETALRTAKTIVTVQRPTGVMYGIVTTPSLTYTACLGQGERHRMPVIPAHEAPFISRQQEAARTYGAIEIAAPTDVLGSKEIYALPEADNPDYQRGLQALDRISALDSHKAAVIYLGEGQVLQAQILSNVMGSPDYVEFLQDLGDHRKLKGAKFNTQGLDRSSDADGEHAIVWHNDVTELVYHTATMMPTRKDTDPTCIAKMAHIGNDFVKIVFNNSGFPYNVDTFASDFNFANIIITPSARTSFVHTRTHTMKKIRSMRFYEVILVTKGDAPAISSATETKIISGECLPGYVRNLALNACIFALLWTSRNAGEVGEYPSSWQARLHQIERIRDRFGTPIA